ncbi:hypothetical protein, partial [Holospora obtusa]|uniref:hypothetical protein n=1 Tax=Holospora obtusa TaxID=49893 RepID=UPI00058BE19D
MIKILSFLVRVNIVLMLGTCSSYGIGKRLSAKTLQKRTVQITGTPLPSLPVLESYDFKGQTHVIFKGGSGILTGLQDVETLEVQNAETIILDSPILNALDIRVQAKTLVSKHKLVSKNVNIEVLNAWIGSGAQQVYQGSGGLSWSWQNQDPSLLLAHQYGVFPLTLTATYPIGGRSSLPSGFRLSTWKSDLSQGWSVGALELKECARVWLCGELQVQNLSLSNSVLKLSGGLDAQHVVLDQASVCVEGLTLECLQGKFPITNPGAAYIKDIQGTGVISNQGGMVYLGNSGVLPVKLDVSCPNFGFGFGNWQSWTFVGGTVLQRNITGSSANLFSGRWIMGGCVGSLVAPDQGIQSPDSAILDWMNRVEARPQDADRIKTAEHQDADRIKTAEHRLQDADWMDAAGKRHFSNFIQGNRVWIQSWAPDIGGEVVWGASGNLKKGIVLAPSTATNIVFKNFDELLIVGDVCAQSVEFQGKRLLHMGKMVCQDAKLQLDTWHQWSGRVDWGQQVVDITNESWDSWSVLGQVRCYGHIRATHLAILTGGNLLFSGLSNLSCLPNFGFFKTSCIDRLTFHGAYGFVGDGLVVRHLSVSGTLHAAGTTEIECLQLASGTFVTGPCTVSAALKWVRGSGVDHGGNQEWWESTSGALVITPPAFADVHTVQGSGRIQNIGGFLALHGLIDQRKISISGQSIAVLPSTGNAQRSGLRAVPGTLFGESKAVFWGKQVLMPETVLGGALFVNTIENLGNGRYFVPYLGALGSQKLASGSWALNGPQGARRKYLCTHSDLYVPKFKKGLEEDALVQYVLSLGEQLKEGRVSTDSVPARSNPAVQGSAKGLKRDDIDAPSPTHSNPAMSDLKKIEELSAGGFFPFFFLPRPRSISPFPEPMLPDSAFLESMLPYGGFSPFFSFPRPSHVINAYHKAAPFSSKFDAREQVWHRSIAEHHEELLYALKGQARMFGTVQLMSAQVFDEHMASMQQLMIWALAKKERLCQHDALQQKQACDMAQVYRQIMGHELSFPAPLAALTHQHWFDRAELQVLEGWQLLDQARLRLADRCAELRTTLPHPFLPQELLKEACLAREAFLYDLCA